jgi:hypothetical protein
MAADILLLAPTDGLPAVAVDGLSMAVIIGDGSQQPEVARRPGARWGGQAVAVAVKLSYPSRGRVRTGARAIWQEQGCGSQGTV